MKNKYVLEALEKSITSINKCLKDSKIDVEKPNVTIVEKWGLYMNMEALKIQKKLVKKYLKNQIK